MSVHRIDNIFKERLGDGSMPVPADLWQNLEPYLPSPRKRNRWGLLWITGAGILLAGALTSWMLLKNDNSHQQIEQSISTTQLSNGISANEQSKTTAINEASQETSIAEDVPHVSSSGSAITTTTVIHNAIKKPSSHQALGVVKESADEMEMINNTARVEIASGVAVPAVSQSIGVTYRKADAVSGLSSHNYLLATPIRLFPDPTLDCYKFGRKGSRGTGGGGVLFAEAYVGPGFASRNLTSRDEDVSSYITQRDTTESSRLSWHAGLRVGYWHHSGITGRVGAHYTQVNELFDYVDGSFSGTITRTDTIFDGNGNIDSIYTVLVPVSGQRIVTWHNRYHTIDVPLLIGYQVGHNNWTYGIQAGPVFNLAFVKKGLILSPVGDVVSISDDDDMQYPAYPTYKDKLGLSIYASAHLAYRIGYRTSVYAETYFQKRLKSLTLDSYPIDQKQTNFGLSLGLRVILQ